MQFDESLWHIIQTHWWKWARRGNNQIAIIIWHATRSGIRWGEAKGPYGAIWTPEWEYTATKNWFISFNNGANGLGIAGMANTLIGGGKICECVPESLVPRYSAGVHDYVAISVEVAQGMNDQEYDPRDIALCKKYAADLRKRYPIAVHIIPFLTGTAGSGEVGHENTTQGAGQGKSDPGQLFWKAYLSVEDDELSEEDKQRIANLEIGVNALKYILCAFGTAAKRHPAVPPDVEQKLESQINWDNHPVRPDGLYTLTGDDAVRYNYIMGNSAMLGLSETQRVLKDHLESGDIMVDLSEEAKLEVQKALRLAVEALD